VGIDPGRFQAGVTEEFLNDADVVIGLQQVGGKGVAEGVGGDALENLRPAYGIIERFLKIVNKVNKGTLLFIYLLTLNLPMVHFTYATLSKT
jgi:hypothetical protein